MTLALMSRQPASCSGWLPTIPTGWPATAQQPPDKCATNTQHTSMRSKHTHTHTYTHTHTNTHIHTCAHRVERIRCENKGTRTAQTGKARDDVLGVVGHNLVEVALWEKGERCEREREKEREAETEREREGGGREGERGRGGEKERKRGDRQIFVLCIDRQRKERESWKRKR